MQNLKNLQFSGLRASSFIDDPRKMYNSSVSSYNSVPQSPFSKKLSKQKITVYSSKKIDQKAVISL